MQPTLEVTFTPADFETLKTRDLSQTFCVVFDILRATTSMNTALGNGATRIFPVREISEALTLHRRYPDSLLAGERHGMRIRAAQTGSIDFDLGNSPCEFTPERVGGKTIIMSTTNGTRALQACIGAKRIFAGSFLNLAALVQVITAEKPHSLIVVAAGTFEEAAYEDTVAAGALCDALWGRFEEGHIVDSVRIARTVYATNKGNILGAFSQARNGRRLLEKPELRDDVPFCAQQNIYSFAAEVIDSAVVKCSSI